MKPTKKQLFYFNERKKHSSIEATAEALGVNYSTVRSALKAMEGKGYYVHPERNHPHLPPGYQLGKTTLQVDYREDPDGKIVQEWARGTPEAQTVEQIAEYLKTRIPPSPLDLKKTNNYDPNVMLQIDFADIHYGMHAWGKETLDGDYDIKIAQDLVKGSMQEIFSRAGRVKQTLLVLYGDNFHADFFNAMTEASGHFLDMDGRYPKVLFSGLETFISAIDCAATQSDEVRVIVLRGNHDNQTSVGLQTLLHVHYRAMNTDKITIDMAPSKTHYHIWGCVAQNFHHGDKVTPANLCGDIMQYCGKNDISGIRDWRANQAHKHSEERKDISGVLYECKPSPVARDAFAAGSGYWARRAAVATTFHKEYGELWRYTVSPRQLEMRVKEVA